MPAATADATRTGGSIAPEGPVVLASVDEGHDRLMAHVVRSSGALAWRLVETLGSPSRWLTQLSDDMDDVWEPFLRDER